MMDDDMDVIQLKLISGCEIICEVMEWPESGPQSNDDMIIRHAFQMSLLYNDDDEVKYGLKPWMTMQDGDMQYIVLDSKSIIGRSRPITHFRQEFTWAIEQSKKIRKGRDVYYEELIRDEELEVMSELKKSIDNIANSLKDSSSSNILSFPASDTDTKIH